MTERTDQDASSVFEDDGPCYPKSQPGAAFRLGADEGREHLVDLFAGECTPVIQHQHIDAALAFALPGMGAMRTDNDIGVRRRVLYGVHQQIHDRVTKLIRETDDAADAI